MIEAARSGLDYRVTWNGEHLLSWSTGGFDDGAQFVFDGVRYTLRCGGDCYCIADDAGHLVATAKKDGSRWTLSVAGRTYEFHRSRLTQAIDLVGEDGLEAGTVTRRGALRQGIRGDLPGLSPPVAVFAFLVSLQRRLNRGAAAAGAAAEAALGGL